MLSNPFLTELQDSRTVLLAGAGGGFDVFSALPLFFALRDSDKHVHLANLSFTNLRPDAGRRLVREVVEITPDSPGGGRYFPEKHLSKWFADQGTPVSVWAIERYGPAAVTRAYQALHDELDFDTVVLVDGGTDSLMRGDESGLGTPVEDISSIAAACALPAGVRKYLVCLGFGVDHFHGVSHMDVLEAVAELAKAGGYLGAFSLTAEMSAVKSFVDATQYVVDQTSSHPSIVCTSILSAIAGEFGNFHATSRTTESELFINPLMALYWCFRLDEVAHRNLYLKQVQNIEGYIDTEMAIERFRDMLPRRKEFRGIPL